MTEEAIQITLPSDLGMSKEEVEKALQAIKRAKLKKEKKDNPEEILLVLKKKAFNFINSNYRKFVIIEEGEGYYVVAHSEKLTILRKHEQSTFQPVEFNGQEDFCIVSIIQYNKVNEDELKKYSQMNCKRIVFKK